MKKSYFIFICKLNKLFIHILNSNIPPNFQFGWYYFFFFFDSILYLGNIILYI